MSSGTVSTWSNESRSDTRVKFSVFYKMSEYLFIFMDFSQGVQSFGVCTERLDIGDTLVSTCVWTVLSALS